MGLRNIFKRFVRRNGPDFIGIDIDRLDVDLRSTNPRYYIRKALSIDPEGPLGHLAFENMFRAVELDPQNAKLWILLARLFRVTWGTKTAAYCIGVANSINPKLRSIRIEKDNLTGQGKQNAASNLTITVAEMAQILEDAKSKYDKMWKGKQGILSRGSVEEFLYRMRDQPWYEV